MAPCHASGRLGAVFETIISEVEGDEAELARMVGHVDLVVSRHHGVVGRMMLGSTADARARLVGQPLLVIRHATVVPTR